MVVKCPVGVCPTIFFSGQLIAILCRINDIPFVKKNRSPPPKKNTISIYFTLIVDLMVSLIYGVEVGGDEGKGNLKNPQVGEEGRS